MPDTNVTEGESCAGSADPLQAQCQCCERSCGNWESSPCASDSAGFKTCVPAGTCGSPFVGGQVSALSCGSGSSCECCDFDTGLYVSNDPSTPQFSACNPANNVATGDEACDGSDLRGETCQSLGFSSGTLACASDCQSYDASACLTFGSCCDGSSCTPNTTDAACAGTFIENAPVCTPNLCASGGGSPQPSGTAIELGVVTVGPRNFISSGSSSCTGNCFFGTAGGMLESNNGTRYVVSNAHVWASPAGFRATDNCAVSRPPLVGDVVRTSFTDSLTCPSLFAAGNDLGELSAFTHLTPGSERLSDVAFADTSNVPALERPVPVIMGLGDQAAGAPVAATLGMFVIKAGARTGYTIGQVSGIDAIVVVIEDAGDASDSGYGVVFNQQLWIDGLSPDNFFSQGGDSGSMVFEYGTMRGVGVLHAGNSVTGDTVVSPLDNIIAEHFPTTGGQVASDAPVRKRRVNGAHHHHFVHPMRSFVPQRTALRPSASNLASAKSVNHACFEHDAVVRELVANRTFVASYVGHSRDDETLAQYVLVVSNAEARLQALARMPSHFSGVPLRVRVSEPITGF